MCIICIHMNICICVCVCVLRRLSLCGPGWLHSFRIGGTLLLLPSSVVLRQALDYVALAGQELAMQVRLACNSRRATCLCISNSGLQCASPYIWLACSFGLIVKDRILTRSASCVDKDNFKLLIHLPLSPQNCFIGAHHHSLYVLLLLVSTTQKNGYF